MLLPPNPISLTQAKQKSKKLERKPKTNKLFTARFSGLWRNYKIPETISKSAYQRLKGAYMGYNSFDGAMENWPHARWGNKHIHSYHLKSINLFLFVHRSYQD